MLAIFDLLLQEFPVYGGVFLFTLGAIMGSFVHCMGYRVSAGMSLRNPPSQCGGCKRTLTPIDLIPVISYLMFRGKCRKCGVHFSALYVLIEIFAGLGFVVLYALFQNIFLAGVFVAFWWGGLGVFSYLLHKKAWTSQE